MKVEENIVAQQDEIFIDEDIYRTPEIDILSKPDGSSTKFINQEELNLNAEKLKIQIIFEDDLNDFLNNDK